MHLCDARTQDSIIMVLKSCSFTSGTSIGCNDNSCNSQSKTSPVVLQANEPVYIAVGSYFDNSYGTGMLTVSTTDPIPTVVSTVKMPFTIPFIDLGILTFLYYFAPISPLEPSGTDF